MTKTKLTPGQGRPGTTKTCAGPCCTRSTGLNFRACPPPPPEGGRTAQSMTESESMKILLACEESGRVRDEFLARGHDAVSLDLLPTSSPGPHRQEALTRDILREGWDLVIAFPPCTDLSCAGTAHWARKQADGSQQRAYEFVRMIHDSPVPRVAIENPVGWLNTNWRKPDQIIHPWNFGDPYKKRTCLWLKGLSVLVPDVVEPPAQLEYWITGQSRRRPDGTRGYMPGEDPVRRGKDKAFHRSKTFPGIARAMAETWG